MATDAPRSAPNHATPLDGCGHRLRAYFYSGWAFFIPYLLAYLLYAWLKWPVNPSKIGVPATFTAVPSLLTTYYILHAVHLLFAGLALHTRWRDRQQCEKSSGLHSLSPALWQMVPWFCLALLFYIPGVYLEWPSDPWEHLRRINEWQTQSEIVTHSSWLKFGYVLPFTLVRNASVPTEIGRLNGYVTFVSLLLSWQYYRLARAAGLEHRTALFFVFLHAVTFGNNAFSFHRYYGLSSSVLAQIGAVALTRTAIEVLIPKASSPCGSSGGATSMLKRKSQSHGLSVLLLSLLISCTHLQAAAISGLSVAAVVFWRLVSWRKQAIAWIIGGAALGSFAILLWYPYDRGILDACRAHGWIGRGFGFNLLWPHTPAFDRTIQITGPVGIPAFVCGLWLLARNHVIGWLTVFPFVALALPCIAVPLAQELVARGGLDYIVTFHRLLFAVPGHLSIVVVGFKICQHVATSTRVGRGPVIAGSCALGGLLLMPGWISYDRFWNAFGQLPADLHLNHITSHLPEPGIVSEKKSDTLSVRAPIVTSVEQAFHPTEEWWLFRRVGNSGSNLLDDTVAQFAPWIPQSSSVEETSSGEGQIKAGDLPPSPNFAQRQDAIRNPQLLFDSNWSDRTWDSENRTAPRIEFTGDTRILSNPSGASVHLFSSATVPIDPRRRFLIEMDVRQTTDGQASNYLAVSWHRKNGTWLRSSADPPAGAGNPRGWLNGPWSYFGLKGDEAEREWQTYSTRFGFQESGAIPSSAASIRLGALLNYKLDSKAVVELRNIRLWQLPDHSYCTTNVPRYEDLTSVHSFAALLSRHWLPTAVAHFHVGDAEIQDAVANYLNAEGFRPSR